MSFEMRHYQTGALDAFTAGVRNGMLNQLITLPTGTGKCLAKGTPVLLYDGRVVPVENVRVEDQLMGPDSTPRVVLSLSHGQEEMYRVTPAKGEPYVVNESHILSLKMTKGASKGSGTNGGEYTAGTIINISVRDYLLRSKTFKHCAKGYRVGVEFPKHEETARIPMSPYFIGLWLGDGTSRNQAITTTDKEIVEYLKTMADVLDLNLTKSIRENRAPTYLISGIKKKANPVLDALHWYGVIGNKHIPQTIKTGTRSQRLLVLAGLVDSDGSLSDGTYDLVFKVKRLAEDVVFVARSLGFAAYLSSCEKTCTNNGVCGDYYRICISGDISIIPVLISHKKAQKRIQKKDVLVHGITVEPVGNGDYYGFEIDGDRRFLLGDFTVTHNTVVFVRAAQYASISGTVLIIAHRDRLISQAKAKWLEAHPDDRVGIEMGTQRTTGGHYNCIVSSVQTLKGERLAQFIEAYRSGVGLIICDEAHHSTEPSYTNIFKDFGCLPVDMHTGLRPDGTRSPILLGVTATPKRLDKHLLESVYPYAAFDYPLLDAMREKYLCAVKAFRVETKVDLTRVGRTGAEFNQRELAEKIDVKPRVDLVVKNWVKLGGMSRRTADFCTSKEQCHSHAAEYRKKTPNVYVITEETKTVEREEMFTQFSWGPLPQVIISVDVMTEGTDIPQLDMIVNSAPTKSGSRFMQRIGRGLRNFLGGNNPMWPEHRTWPALLEKKEHLLFLDIVDTVKSQSDIMTVPRILGLPANFNLNGDDLLDAKNMMDEVLSRNPALEAALETMAETDEKMPKTFNELKAQLQRIMLFAPNNPRGKAKDYSTLSWLAADERAIMENDADNSHAYVLNIPPPKDRTTNEPQQQRFMRLEYRPRTGFWYIMVQAPNAERTALEREAAFNANKAKDDSLPSYLKGQYYQKARAANEAAALLPLVTLKDTQLYPDLRQSMDHVDNYVRRRYSSALTLIDMNAVWRKRKPSPGQLWMAKRNQIPIHPDMKAGDVSDLINNHKNLKSHEENL